MSTTPQDSEPTLASSSSPQLPHPLPHDHQMSEHLKEENTTNNSNNGDNENGEYTLYEAIHERYSYNQDELTESLKNFTLLFNYTGTNERARKTSENGVSGGSDDKANLIGTSPPALAESPRKLNSLNSRAIVLSDKSIGCVGTDEQMSELTEICPNLLELDLSRNKFKRWSEIKKILDTFKNLKFLNLSSNRDLSAVPSSDVSDEAKPAKVGKYSESSMKDDTNKSEAEAEGEAVAPVVPLKQLDLESKNWWSNNLSTLILNQCYIDLCTVEHLLTCLPNLDELYLAHNDYSQVTFTPTFVHTSLRKLYFNNNLIDDWSEVHKLGTHFVDLETLVISENPIAGVKEQQQQQQQEQQPQLFRNLKNLTINKLNLNDWNDLERIKKEFAALKHLKIQNIPLLKELESDDEKFMMLLAYFGDSIDFLNGSQITAKERNSAERKFLRYFMKNEGLVKPPRYYQLEAKHGKLNKLAEVNFDKDLFVNVRIKCGDKSYYEKIDTRQTVGAFKNSLEKYANCKAACFRLFYHDHETVETFGPEELKLMNISLGRTHLKDGDEFEIVPKSSQQNK